MAMLKFHWVDVFTDQPFGGNQLAVFPFGEEVPPELMQPIAKELNFSETAFVFVPKNPKNHAKVRIFTPARELPMAGHPTVGTAFVLARQGLISGSGPRWEITFEEGVGDIPVSIEWKHNKPDVITMTQPLPTYGPIFPDRDLLAEMLSIKTADLHPNNPPEVISTGVPYLIIPVTSLKTIRSIKLRLDLWEQHLKNYSADHVFVFSTETKRPGSTVHCRMFAPGSGVMEDPATGSASGPLGCYLLKHSLIDPQKTGAIISEQGFEIGRPSIIHISIEHSSKRVTKVQVGGRSVYMGEGILHI